MQKTVVIDVVGLSRKLVGEYTPFLKQWSQHASLRPIQPVLPAVTTSSQYTYLTGKWPAGHGIVGNGWYFRDESEVKLWRQSNRLVKAEKIWEALKKQNPDFTCANMFWWYNMYSSVDYSVTPRPLYPANGLKLPDCHTQPMDLRDRLQSELGQFPLFNFWGPRTSVVASQWIADASKLVDTWHNPTLTLVYLPHLDYNLQRKGTSNLQGIAADLAEIDALLQDLVLFYEERGAQVVILSEYGITDADQPVHINRVLRQNGYITVKNELGTETLDTGTCRAFAVADHQIAHVYIQNPADIPPVKQLLQDTPGIDLVLDEQGKKQHHINHQRAGELVAVADKHSWFTYYFWLDDAKAPDYARTVDIHRKPGYDPVEMFADPKIKLLPLKVGSILLKKKLGFRYLMDIIPLDATLVKGSHGRLPESQDDWPVFMTRKEQPALPETISAPDVYHLLMEHVLRQEQTV